MRFEDILDVYNGNQTIEIKYQDQAIAAWHLQTNHLKILLPLTSRLNL